MITLRQLHVFEQVVQAGSFRRCGERMGMSQVSVSEHVRALEARWGVLLFERRSGAAPVLTDAGREAHQRIALILADVADLENRFIAPPGGSRRRVPIAMHAYMARDLYPLIAGFEERYAVSVDLDLALNPAQRLAERVATRDLDLAYFFALSEMDVPGSKLVRSEPLAVFVGPGHRFARQPVVTLEELAAEPAAQTSTRDPLRTLIGRAFDAVGLPERRIGLETDDFGLIMNFVVRNRGYACLFASMPQDPANIHGVIRVPLTTPLPPLQIRLVSRRTSQRDDVLAAFMTIMADPPEVEPLG